LWQCRAVVSVAGARVAVERVEVAGAREREAVCGVCGAVWQGGVWAPHGGGEARRGHEGGGEGGGAEG